MHHSRLSRNCCITALLLGTCLPAQGQDRPESERHGQPPTLSYNPADLPALLKAAKDAGIGLEYSNTTTTEHAAGDGASATATGDKLDQSLNSTAPTAALPGKASANGGDTQAKQHAEVTSTVWWTIGCCLMAALCLAGAGFCLYRTPPQVKNAAIAGAGAVGFLFAGFFPGVTVFILGGLAILGLVAWYAETHAKASKAADLDANQGALIRLKSAYDALVDGLALSPHASSIAPSIRAQATPEDVAHIETTAAANGNPVKISA